MENVGWVVHDRSGPAVTLSGEDALGERVTLCVVGEPPRLRVRCPPGVQIPRDADLLDDVMEKLNRTLAARYVFACADGRGGTGQPWVTSISTDDNKTARLIRSWRVEPISADAPAAGSTAYAIVALFAHPEHVAWARRKLQRPLGQEYQGNAARPWLEPEVLARLWGESEADIVAATDPGRWGLATMGETRYEHELLKRAGLKVGDTVAVSATLSVSTRYTSDAREQAVALSALSRVAPTKKRKKGAPEMLAQAPDIPPAASEWHASRFLSSIRVRLDGGRGWATGTPDALKRLTDAGGWRSARVMVGDKRHQGAYAAHGATEAGVKALYDSTWK